MVCVFSGDFWIVLKPDDQIHFIMGCNMALSSVLWTKDLKVLVPKVCPSLCISSSIFPELLGFSYCSKYILLLQRSYFYAYNQKLPAAVHHDH